MSVYGSLDTFAQNLGNSFGPYVERGLQSIGNGISIGAGSIANSMNLQAEAEDRKAEAIGNISQGLLDAVDLLKEMWEAEQQAEKEQV